MARNKYGGHCYRCGKYCYPGQGHFERIPGKGWRVQHVECCLKAREEKAKAQEKSENVDTQGPTLL